MHKNKFLLIGALTSKPYAFTARSWELKNIETIDLFDSLVSNIKIDVRGSEIMRILPLNNAFVNDEWISDKARYSYDGLKRWRFITPMIKKDNIFIQSSWWKAAGYIRKKIRNIDWENLVCQTGNFTDLETITILDDFVSKFPNIINSDVNLFGDIQNYLIDSKELNNIVGRKVIFLVGSNLRLENPILNIKLKKLSQSNNILIAFIGSKYDFNFNIIHLGTNIHLLLKIFAGKHKFSSLLLNFLKFNNNNNKIKTNFKNEISFFFGTEFINKLNNVELIEVLSNFNIFKLNHNINILSNYSGKINALELGFYNNNQKYEKKEDPNVVYMVGSEFYPNIKKNDIVLFQGHHNDKIRTKFDAILPTINWTEKSSLYLNCFGLIQKTKAAIIGPVQARIDWKIVKLFSIIFKTDIKLNSIKEIHQRIDELTPNLMLSLFKYKSTSSKIKIFNKIKNYEKQTFYMFTPFKTYTPQYYGLNSVEKIIKNYDGLSKNK